MSLTNDLIADLRASDYPILRFISNVNATTLPDYAAFNEDGMLLPGPGIMLARGCANAGCALPSGIA